MLLLQHNNLTSISDAAFAGAERLDRVDLSSNSIAHVHPDAFAAADNLHNLSLAHNPLQLRADAPLLNAPGLHALSLESCNLTAIYNATFEQLTGLGSLNARGNRFGADLNAAAFANMTHLARLQLSELPADRMAELCRLASAIDLITGDAYELSCFMVSAGNAVEDSTNTPAPPPGTRKEVKGEFEARRCDASKGIFVRSIFCFCSIAVRHSATPRRCSDNEAIKHEPTSDNDQSAGDAPVSA